MQQLAPITVHRTKHFIKLIAMYTYQSNKVKPNN